jgi:hypothetical protein
MGPAQPAAPKLVQIGDLPPAAAPPKSEEPPDDL